MRDNVFNMKTNARNINYGYGYIILSAFLIICIAEFIGTINIPLGSGKIALLPMVWALILGCTFGLLSQKQWMPLKIDKPLQIKSAHILYPALLVFIAKQGLIVGSSIPLIIQSGWALLFQELGHFVGTILFAMPIALLLGIKRESIGATFSVGREPSLAIITEKYGLNSAEGRGVLAEYITGTLIGALFIAIVAGFIASLNIFHPLSLAMASGIGSGSMMAAAAGAISAQVDPATAEQVMALAAASNLLTTTLGTYFTLFISLPLAIYAYKILEPVLGRFSKRNQVEQHDNEFLYSTVKESEEEKTKLSLAEKAFTWIALIALATTANTILTGKFSATVIIAGVILVLISILGDLIYHLTGKKVPTVCYVSIIAMYMASPWFPWHETVTGIVGEIHILSVITPMLAFAGLSIAKDIPAFRKLGWRIVVVSLCANFGTFIAAAFVAEFFH
ncbi:branched-chain amino acid ABC transporter permease [Acinetobacter sp. C15]|uniref:DUF3100 domain-containing protein n=2 Tax=Acinetobacter TaxID=469 RepID=UPI00066091A4|nr:DUF3100 domain-containing protein [Acinetobacter soli]KOR13297.1 branched-chain amino acid ABC transporter permease [Acinetobacter sp. C15]